MRRIFLILMIALLPVRGWATDVMGIVMAAQELSAVQRIAAHTDQSWTAVPSDASTPVVMPADCPMGTSRASDDDASAAYQGCATCQLCMALSTCQTCTLIDMTSSPPALPGLAFIGFSSAERAPGFKPPIS